MGEIAGIPIQDTKGPSKWKVAKRPTGQEIFDSLSKDKQDEMLGPAAAEQVRKGEATLSDFVEKDGDFIRQKPVQDLGKAFDPSKHPRGGDPKNPGRFSPDEGISGGLGPAKPRRPKKPKKRELPDWFWSQTGDAWLPAILVDPDVSESVISLPKDVKRVGKGKALQATLTVLWRDRVSGAWYSFIAKCIVTPNSVEFPEADWGGKPEWRPGYVPSE